MDEYVVQPLLHPSSYVALGVTLDQWIVFFVVVVVAYLGLRLVLKIAQPRFAKMAERTDSAFDDGLVRVFKQTRWYGYLGLSTFLAVHVADLQEIDRPVRSFALLLFFIQVGVWGNALIDTILEHGFRVAKLTESTARTASGVVRWFALVILWLSVLVLILGAFHIEITPLIAGLGVGGIAIAFALQQILGDIFCSVAIVLDRPFEVGDFIISGDCLGTVERIGIKTTRLRSLGGEQIVIPNADLIGSRVRNYKRMQQRRIEFSFGVIYATPPEQLQQIPNIVREIIESIEQTKFDRAHFSAFGDSALNFVVVYYVLSPDYNVYMNIQQNINLQLLTRCNALGIDMAFPSRTLYLDRDSAMVFAREAFGNGRDNANP